MNLSQVNRMNVTRIGNVRAHAAWRLVVVVFAFWGLSNAVQAQLTASFVNGTSSMAVNQSSQFLDLLVSNPSGGTAYNIVSLNLNIEVDGSTPNYPSITSLDVTVPGTIFASNNTGNQSSKFSDQIWNASAITQNGTVQFSPGQQYTLVHIGLDTTASLGNYTLNLTSPQGDTHFNLDSATQVSIPFSGTLTVVPEVNATFPAALALAAFAIFWRWQRARGAAPVV
jgi:hypothetical protein